MEIHPFLIYVSMKNLLDLTHFQHQIILIYVPFLRKVFRRLLCPTHTKNSKSQNHF